MPPTHPLATCRTDCWECSTLLKLRTAGPCPRCLRSDRTIRVNHPTLGPARCVRCSLAFDPATASSTTALPADPSLAHPGDGEADVAVVFDGEAGNGDPHPPFPALSTTNDEGAGSYPDALLTA